MGGLFYDLRYSLRLLRRAPLFSLGIIATLALAVGANTLLFAVANAAIFRRLPYPDSSRIIFISVAQKGIDSARMDEPTARLAMEARLPPFESLATYNSAGATLAGGEYPVRLNGARVSAPFFDVMGVQPALGRTFTDDELRPGGPAAIILSDAVWTRTFGRRPDIVGQSIVLDDRSVPVVGVMPPGFSYPMHTARSEFWLPLIPRTISGGVYYVDFVGRLQQGATVEQARNALVALRDAREREIPAAALRTEIRVMPLQQRLYGDFRRPLYLLLGTVACVLLIGCANIANLLLARSSVRRTELAVRLAVGASKGRLVRQLLVESVLLACFGALPGIALAVLGLRAFKAFGPPVLARIPTLAIDNQVLLFTGSVALCTGLLFGLAPAFAAARADPQDGLRGRASDGRGGRWRPRRALVVLEIAAAVVLTLGAALLVKSFSRFQSVDPGFHADDVLMASITLSSVRYPNDASRRTFFDALIERLQTLPEVESVSLSEIGLVGMSFTTEWPPPNQRKSESWEIAVATGVGADHFRTFGIPILEGRECANRDGVQAAVINRTMARRSYGDRSPLGQQLDLSNLMEAAPVIVGVAADIPAIRSKAPPLPTVYTCAAPNRAPGFGTIAIRTRANAASPALASGIRAAVRTIDPAQPVGRLITLEDMIREGVSSRWFDAAIIGALSLLALILALGGLYAVTAYHVAHRTREIGVRMALGAARPAVLMLVLRQSGALVLAGTCIGVLAAIPLVRLIGSMLFEVQPLDPMVFAFVSLVVAVVAMGATFIPAHRASLVDPMTALRAE